MTRTEEMRAAFARFEESGLTLKAFGEREQISYTTLQYWRRRFRDEVVAPKDGDTVALAPVHVVPDETPASLPGERFEVWLSNGVSLEVPRGFDEGELRRLVGVLLSC